jgi:hypothetical protein
MTETQLINLERLSKADRAELGQITDHLFELTLKVETLRNNYQGKTHTHLDRAVCVLSEAAEILLEMASKQRKLL